MHDLNTMIQKYQKADPAAKLDLFLLYPALRQQFSHIDAENEMDPEPLAMKPRALHRLSRYVHTLTHQIYTMLHLKS